MIANSVKKTLFVTSAICIFAMAGVTVGADHIQAQPYDSSAAAAAEVRFQQLEKEIRRLTGQIEEQNYEIRRLREELAKAIGDLGVRVKDLEQGGGGSATVSSSNSYSSNTAEPESPTTIVPPPSQQQQSSLSFQYQPPEGGQTLGTINKSQSSATTSSSDSAPRAYDYAYSFVKARNFDRAEDEFAKFMKDFPNHPLVSNAKYWYGETFYVRGNYEKAARIFAEGYQQFPRGPKAASNLLKLGMALTGMGKKDDACIAYKQLKKDYAKSSVPVLKRADTEMKRINCR